MRNLLILALCAILSACAAESLKMKRDQLAGQPEEYKDGYVDGCNSGTKTAGNPYYQFKKDANRFDTDKLYAQGWGDGFNICKSEYEYIQRMTHR